MKNLIGILTVTLVLFFTGISDVSAQWLIEVNWNDQCGGCPGPGGYEYYVCYSITNICTQLPVDSDCVIKSSSATTHTFDVGQICDIDEEEACFRVAVSVTKRCVFNQYEICHDSDYDDVNCFAIYNDELIFSLLLES
jgi:hypothetical protein